MPTFDIKGKDIKDTTEITPDKIKNMPQHLFDYYIKRIKKMVGSKDKEHIKFIESLPGGNYYKLLNTLNLWRKPSLSPAELIKKYSKTV